MTKHPAKFSDAILERVGALLQETRHDMLASREPLVLDPFAGVGKIHQFPDLRSVGVEIEPEWATMHPRTIVANTLYLPFRTGVFDGMITSPCLAQEHRVLTNDLTWVPVGNVGVGDELLAFDEFPLNSEWRGSASRRRWRRAVVLRSEPKRTWCVRVVLENGDEIVTTPDHPWLSYRYSYRGFKAEWTISRDLMDSPWVMRQVAPWSTIATYRSGWLAGLFDGEGSVSLGAHGCPKLMMCQVLGPVVDAAESAMHDYGYQPNRIVRKGTPDGRQKVANLYVTGGFPNLLRALGEIRPIRLLRRWNELDISTRTIQAEKVRVVAVEPAGSCDIQEIETSTGTYFGEGYLMHNCYGNRLADHHDAKDGSVRHSYTHTLGRKLHADNSGTLHWGDAYRQFHDAAWTECLRVLRSDAFVLLNVSNHIRRGKEQPVVDWHLTWFLLHHCVFVELEHITTPRLRAGANHDARTPHEFLLHFRYQPERAAA